METSKLTSAFFHPNNSESRKKPKAEMAKTRFYLKKVGTPANRPTLIPLNPAAELRDCIRGRMVDEYPTIYVTAGSGHPRGFEIARSIAADAKGKLEVLEETSKGDIVVINMKNPVALIGLDREKSEEDIPAVGGTETKISKDVAAVKDGTTPESRCLQDPVDGSSVADGGVNEARAAIERANGGTQDGLVENALLEVIGANGISIEVMDGKFFGEGR